MSNFEKRRRFVTSVYIQKHVESRFIKPCSYSERRYKATEVSAYTQKMVKIRKELLKQVDEVFLEHWQYLGSNEVQNDH